MKRERLQKLFSEDKEIFQGGMLFPTWICKGKEEIENRNIPQRAAVYLDIPIPCAGLLYYEKEKSLHYCEQQTYQVVTLLEGVGCDYSIEKENWQRLAVLAGKGMIDVIVVSGLSRLSYCPEGNFTDYGTAPGFPGADRLYRLWDFRLCQTETIFNAHLGETGTI